MSSSPVDLLLPILAAMLVVGILALGFVLNTFLGQRKTLHTLAKSEKKYRYLFENSVIGMLRYDIHSGLILEMNDALMRILSVASTEEAARILQLSTEHSSHNTRQILLSRGVIDGQEFNLRRSDGSTVWVNLSATLNQAEGYYEIAVADISQQKAAAAALRQVSQGIVAAEETERQRVALELHDGVNQTLSIVKRNLTTLDGGNKRRKGRRGPGYDRVLNLVQSAMDDIRRVSRNLRPAVLDHLGLIAAIRALADEFARTNGIAVEFSHSRIPRRIPKDRQLALYRIIQEALANIQKHAKASSVTIRIERVDDGLLLTVIDNGLGLRKAGRSRRKTSGMGLSGMTERATFLGGRVNISSEKGRGTTVTVQMPLRVAE